MVPQDPFQSLPAVANQDKIILKQPLIYDTMVANRNSEQYITEREWNSGNDKEEAFTSYAPGTSHHFAPWHPAGGRHAL